MKLSKTLSHQFISSLVLCSLVASATMAVSNVYDAEQRVASGNYEQLLEITRDGMILMRNLGAYGQNSAEGLDLFSLRQLMSSIIGIDLTVEKEAQAKVVAKILRDFPTLSNSSTGAVGLNFTNISLILREHLEERSKIYGLSDSKARSKLLELNAKTAKSLRSLNVFSSHPATDGALSVMKSRMSEYLDGYNKVAQKILLKSYTAGYISSAKRAMEKASVAGLYSSDGFSLLSVRDAMVVAIAVDLEKTPSRQAKAALEALKKVNMVGGFSAADLNMASILSVLREYLTERSKVTESGSISSVKQISEIRKKYAMLLDAQNTYSGQAATDLSLFSLKTQMTEYLSGVNEVIGSSSVAGYQCLQVYK
tara:strand:+ start:55838 stop:56938 length:1101 start_codon:yes stop_codon:yes gene_type:complete